MSKLVPTSDIERLVGSGRANTLHIGRAVSSKQTFYILHSQRCKDSGLDLRDCPFSVALDRGIRLSEWVGSEDRAVPLDISKGRLVPSRDVTA